MAITLFHQPSVWMCLAVFIFAARCAPSAPKGNFYSSHTDLLQNLSQHFDLISREVPPKLTDADPVIVNLTWAYSRILEVDEKKGVIHKSWLPHLEWKDTRLSWERSDYNITEMSIDSDQIWVPDFEVLNSLFRTLNLRSVVSKAIIFHTGKVILVPHLHVEIPCTLNLMSFPYDVNTCHMYIGSWASDIKTVLFKIKVNDILINAIEHSEFTFSDTQIQEKNVSFSGDPHQYSQITLKFEMARKGSFYYRLFVAPAAVMMFVIPVIHFLPPDSNKLVLGGLMLVAVTIIFEMMEDFFPPFSVTHVPLLLHYYTALLMLIFISLFISALTVILGTGKSKSTRVPIYLRKCCIDKLGYICCARGRTSRYDYELLHLERSLRFSANQASGRDRDQELYPVGDEERRSDDETSDTEETNPNRESNNSTGQDGRSEALNEVLKTLINEMQYKRYKEQVCTEWMQLAIVIDRTFGLIILILSVLITAIITVHSH